ncbi:MAG: methyltransferase, partial [Bacteroidota bacterium]|nr:methyltransferase [Bacteroidota bacterium]
IEDPDLRINVHVSDVTCSVALDSSGMPLSKRGYRHERTLAPISEVLAAGIILLSGWDQKSDFYDPMCGSGTFSIEAALIARNIPFSRFRHFSFEKWNDFDPGLWEQVQKEAEEQVRAFEGRIFGSDMDRKAVEISVQNARRAGVEGQISFKKNDFLSSTPEGEPGVVVLNPPYGERLQSDDIIAFYKEIGTRLKHYYNGCDAWIISANLDALKFIGLKPSRKIKLFNGQLECRLNKYELYRGSKKQGDLMA